MFLFINYIILLSIAPCNKPSLRTVVTNASLTRIEMDLPCTRISDDGKIHLQCYSSYYEEIIFHMLCNKYIKFDTNYIIF